MTADGTPASPSSSSPHEGAVVTRFAPSPTGFLHIGGARTALFNWLFARRHGGRFLLRIEDTDRARSTTAATEAIFDGLRWLGLDWDGEAVSQFSRAPRHAEAAEAMIARGGAYRCYLSAEEAEALKETARAGAGGAFRSPWRDRDPSEAPAGAPFVVRLKAPIAGETVVEDRVQGAVRWSNDTLDDLVLLRSDGVPTYMHAVVVDDHDMGVTHVIRGDDHLVNAARQTLIYHALGWEPPIFAHIPLIHGPDGAKLSKRHGALGVDAYRDMGYLAEGMRNYLARLGWSHGDDELFTTAQATGWFNLESIGKAPARMDFQKLAAVNAHHLKALAPEAFAAAFEAWRVGVGRPALAEAARGRLAAAATALAARAKTFEDVERLGHFVLEDGALDFDDVALAALDAGARAALARLRGRLAALAEWSAATVQAALKDEATAQGVKMGAVAQPFRAALTGRGESPGAVEAAAALGRDLALARLDAALSLA